MKKESEWSDSIKMCVLEILYGHKNEFFTILQLKNILLKTKAFLRDIDFVKWLAFTNGLDGKIMGSIHSLRTQQIPHPIVSSDEKGKGYTYLDPNNENTPNDWDSKFNANETQREVIPDTERKNDTELFLFCLQNCTDVKIRNEMQKIAIKHKIKKKVSL